MKYITLLLLASTIGVAQTVTMGLNSVTATPGSVASLNLQLTAQAGSSPAALEWTVNAPIPDVQSITASLGPAASGASKTISCSGKTCIISGMNNSAIGNGTVAVFTIQLSGTASGNLAVQLSNTSAASPLAAALPVTSVNGQVSVNPPPVVITLTPATVTLAKSQTQEFTASVSGSTNTAVTWSMSPQLGQLSSSGLYTAPSSIPSSSTVTVTATSTADPTKSASAAITLLKDPVAITLAPATVTLAKSQTQQFTASVSGTTNTAVTWSMSPQLGQLSSSGLYTAPSTIPSSSTVTVTATSTADPTKSASATITLLKDPVAITLTPATVSLAKSQTQQFTASVSGSTNSAVTWSMSPQLGQLSSSGLYTAPSTIASSSTVTITATSNADQTKLASATVTLLPPLPPTNGAIAVFGTGTTSQGALAADGTVDSHYTIRASPDAVFPGPNAFVVTSNVFPIGPWLQDGPNSKWIAPQSNQSTGNAPGAYTYHTTFDLTGFNPATATLTGQFAADNSAVIKLNGVVVGSSAPTYYVWTPFTINSGFVAGVNTLDFVVTNGASYANPTGLRVDLSGTATQMGPVPVSVTVSPTTAMLSASQSQPLTVTVSGTTNQAVTWTISPPGSGSMNGNTYVAPSSIASQQIVTLTATSVFDNTKSATAKMTLNPPPTASPITIYGTGATSQGVLAADGTVDSHYTIRASPDAGFPGPNAFVVTSNVFPIGPWLQDGPNSKWIAPQSNQSTGNAPGAYTYHTTFDLTGFNPATAILTGQFAADNSAVIKLNGVVVGSGAPTYYVWTPFTINSGFVAGVNTLDFVVTNGASYPNPTGLRVDIRGTASQGN